MKYIISTICGLALAACGGGITSPSVPPASSVPAHCMAMIQSDQPWHITSDCQAPLLRVILPFGGTTTDLCADSKVVCD